MLLEGMKIIYQSNWILKYVCTLSDDMRGRVTNTARMEELILERIDRYIKGDRRRLNHYRIIKKFIGEVVKQFEDNYKNEEYVLFSQLTKIDQHNEVLEEFEPVDVLANVESEVIAKELATLLAEGDQRKKSILGFWIIGAENNSDISRLLAQTFGGNTESHRKFIARFREECREVLSAAI